MGLVVGVRCLQQLCRPARLQPVVQREGLSFRYTHQRDIKICHPLPRMQRGNSCPTLGLPYGGSQVLFPMP
jgi:hypothetical protein